MGPPRREGCRSLGIQGFPQVRSIVPFQQCREVFTSWLFRYFLRFEKFVPNKSHPGVVEGEHGSNGPIEGTKKSP